MLCKRFDGAVMRCVKALTTWHGAHIVWLVQTHVGGVSDLAESMFATCMFRFCVSGGEVHFGNVIRVCVHDRVRAPGPALVLQLAAEHQSAQGWYVQCG